MYDVVALGELLIDFTCKALDKDGYPTMEAHPGGAPANYLAALAKFGAKTALLGKVGDDAFGRLLRSSLGRAGIDDGGLVTAGDVFTTLAFVTLDESGDREFSFARKPGADARLSPEELRLDYIEQARVFHFGTLSLTEEPVRSSTEKALACAKRLNKLISFDPNLRLPLWRTPDEARKQMLWGLAQADVVKLSAEEAAFLFFTGPENAAEKILNEFGAALVYVTCGAEGCVYQNKKARGRVPALSGLNIVDTTGAGDIFAGAAMFRLLRSGKAPGELDSAELADIVRFACAAAGLSATRPGGISSIPEYEEISALA